MAITSTLVPKQLQAGMQSEFFKAMQARLNALQPILNCMMRAKSSKDSETYPWLKANPAVRRYVSQRIPRQLSESYIQVENYDWEASIEIDQNLLEDEQYDQVFKQAQRLGQRFIEHLPKLFAQRLSEALDGTITADDGQNFFATSHSDGDSGTQSNKLTQALDDDGLTAAANAMMLFNDDKGEILNLVPDTLIIPVALRKSAKQIVESTSLSSATQLKNIHFEGFDIVVNPYLDSYSTSTWYLASCRDVVKPFVFQERRAVTSDWVDNLRPGDKISKRYLVYGADGRYQIWPVFWPGIIACDSGF